MTVSNRKAAKAVGISESSISRLRSNERQASVDMMIRLEEKLGWTVYDQVKQRMAGTYGQRLTWWLEQKL